MHNILFIERSLGHGGSVGSLGRLVRHLDPARYRAYAVVSQPVHREYLCSYAGMDRVLVDQAACATQFAGLSRPFAGTLALFDAVSLRRRSGEHTHLRHHWHVAGVEGTACLPAGSKTRP